MLRTGKSPPLAVCALLPILLTACNRPAQVPSAESIGTTVASTLTAQPSLTPAPTSFPSATASPAATPVPTEESSATPAATPAPDPTRTPLPLDPDDPRSGLDLSSPDVSDDFSAPGTWFEYPTDFEDAGFRWEGGRLRAIDNKVDGFIWWSAGTVQVEDVYVEIDAEIDACLGRDGYGLAVRVGGGNFDRGYTVEFSCDGQYRVRQFISDEAPRTLRDWSPAPSIVQGSGAINRIGFLAVQDQLHFFANGSLLNRQPVIGDDYRSGTLGLFASAVQTPGLIVYFDDFDLWHVSP